jgi:hypothetical protein
MADETNQGRGDEGQSNKGMSGSELQSSQSGGGSGEFGGTMDQHQQADPAGGGVTASDMSNAGGSSGTGGYGSSQDVVNQRDQQPEQGSQSGLAGGDLRKGGGSSHGQSRGERYDEQSGGGRGVEFDGQGGVSAEEDGGLPGDQEVSDFEREA